jgi:membrane associated rhomboid family serine protease
VKRLLIANGVAFFVTLVIGPRFVYQWLAFHPSRVLLQPWGALTYMFVHADFWHVFMNMLVLFFFGPSLESRWGSRDFLQFYVICGLGGVALSFLFAPSAAIVGASAAVYGVMLAFAMAWPNAPIYIWGIFPVKAKWLMAFLFTMTFMSALGGAADGVAHFAHLGGIVTGFLYLKSDWRGTERFSKARTVVRRKLAIVPREEKKVGVATGSPSRESGNEERALLDAVDRVLDKISAEGMSSLTPEERKLLDDVSRRQRSN